MKDRSKCKHKNTIPVFEPHEKPEKYIVFRCADCDMAKNKKGEWIIIDRKNSDMDCLDCKIRLPEWESRFVAFGYILTDALEKIAKNRVGRIGETTTANECAVLAKEALNKFKKGVRGLRGFR